jgi:membrane fusion protein, multidrug efflux system
MNAIAYLNFHEPEESAVKRLMKTIPASRFNTTWPFMVLCAAVLLITGCGSSGTETAPETIRPVKTMILSSVTQQLSRTYPGKVQATQQVDLSFRIAGPLIEFPVNEGQLVQEGDLIARIDPRDYQTKVENVRGKLSEARASLKSMETGARPEDIKVLEAEVNAAKAQLDEAQKNFERYSALYSKDAVSKAQYDRFQSTRDVAQAQYDSAQQNLEKGRKGAREEDIEAQESRIQSLEAELQAAQSALDDTKLTAPFDGIIAEKFVRNFQDVQAKQKIVNFQDISAVEIVINVPEQMMVNAGQRKNYQFTARFDTLLGREFPVTFKEVSTQADPQNQTYELTLVMPAPDDVHLLPGMTAQISISSNAIDDDGDPNVGDYVIPVQATFGDENNTSYVWLLDENTMTVHRAEVTLGELTGQSVIVKKGLKAGDCIVTAGVHFLQEGQNVRRLETPMGKES